MMIDKKQSLARMIIQIHFSTSLFYSFILLWMSILFFINCRVVQQIHHFKSRDPEIIIIPRKLGKKSNPKQILFKTHNIRSYNNRYMDAEGRREFNANFAH